MTSDRASAEKPEAAIADRVKPNRSAVDSTQEWRINSTAMKINDAFNRARIEARDECLWLSMVSRELLHENDRLRIANDALLAKIEKLERSSPAASGLSPEAPEPDSKDHPEGL